jgi:hypothetical protein
MKFKKLKDVLAWADDAPLRGITIKDGDGDIVEAQTRADGKAGLFVWTDTRGVFLTRSKALKLAWAIIEELDPDGTLS